MLDITGGRFAIDGGEEGLASRSQILRGLPQALFAECLKAACRLTIQRGESVGNCRKLFIHTQCSHRGVGCMQWCTTEQGANAEKLAEPECAIRTI